ncbi:MAG TPA: hypothetical protein VGG69_10095 [Rhizomicrobium sp.]
MTRICFIGNSHLAAVKLGWDATSNEYPHLTASFFGAPAAGMSLMVPGGDGYLVSNHSTVTTQLQSLWGTERFRPDDYDVLCLVGMGLSPRTLLRLYRFFRSSVHRNRTGQFRLLSPECFQAAANGRVASMVGAMLLSRLRDVSQRPVILVMQAAPCLPFADGGPQPEWLTTMLTSGDDRLLLESFVDAVRRFPGANFLMQQPEITSLNLFVTKPEYAAGSQRLDPSFSEHEDEDTSHMNATYGALVVRDVHELLRREGLAGGRAAQAEKPALELSV